MSLLQSSRLRSLALVLLCSVAYLGQELILEHYGLHSYALRSQVPRWIYQVLKCDERHLGIIVIIFASLTFGFLSPKGRDWWQDIASIKTSPDRQPNRSLTRYSLLPTGLALLLSISCTVASQHHYLDSGDTFNTRVLWLCGIGLFVVALTFCFTRENRPEHWHTSPTFKCANWVTLVCIVIAAFLLRFWDVGELPKKVNYDVAGVGLFARRNLSESDWRVFGLGDYGVAQLNFAVYSLSMKMFGDNLFGLKMACVIFGTLMVPATYFAAWRSFDCHRIATAAAAFLATNIPSIHFSRHIMNIDPWGVFAGCLFFLAHGMRVYAAWALGAAGLLVAFALHLYLSGRVLCFVIPLFFVLILRHRERWKASLWFGILLFIIGSFVFFGPNVVDIWVNTEAWKGSNRPYSTFLLIRNFYDYARSNHIQTIPEFISSRLWTVLLLIYSRDTSGQTPLGFSFFFNLAITPLFWLGLGVSLFEAKRNPIQLLMSILLLLTMGLGIAIAPVGTYWPKVLCLTLIGAIFIARSGVCVLQACVNIFMPELGQKPVTQARVSRLGVIVSQLFIVGVFTVLGIQNWSLYRVAAARDDFIASALGWYAASLPQGTKVCLAGDQTTHIHLNELPVLFLANKQILRPLASKNSEELFAECGAAPFVWILSNNQSALQEALKQAFPRGKLEDHAGDTGGRLFLSFTVPS